MTITSRNARFQQWQALLGNRAKRQRAGEFLVQGVRPITLAVEHGWTVRALIHPTTGTRSTWASSMLGQVDGEHVAMAPDLFSELAEKNDDTPELLAVVETPPDRLDRIRVDRHRDEAQMLVVVFDRPTSPGNVGTIIRSADAFGAHGVVVTGHAADVYDPKTVRASTGSLFALPTVRADGPHEVIDWARAHDAQIVGTDETGTVDVDGHDLTVPTVLVVGNETKGMSRAWRDGCDTIVRIPIDGAASSLNAAAAATAVLYETARQRRSQHSPAKVIQ
ncbi:RNA methyltransferase [Phytoactinopolyspora halotolerans]|uniref:RNA methyltransferase n=1 Tax=Phytoactinopolyspora halotolerans TaxID=1981512 RepID=A0A6L9SFH1_9ACTN|nr:RNA methyltransferase [Phytoactinopolyspora halotolerans]